MSTFNGILSFSGIFSAKLPMFLSIAANSIFSISWVSIIGNTDFLLAAPEATPPTDRSMMISTTVYILDSLSIFTPTL